VLGTTRSARTTRRHAQRRCTNPSDNAKWSGTGGKTKLDVAPEAKREVMEPAHPQRCSARQCALGMATVNV
jgi:hypothetical protein